MRSDEEMQEENAGTSRRTLLKGAVAAGIGAAVYSSPVVSTVPAYATHGLSSWSVQSGTQCLWFSPNQQTAGQWHHDIYDGNILGNTPPATRLYFNVGGVNREVRFIGDPNNIPGNLGRGTVGETSTFWGGGVGIRLLDPNCEFVVVGVVCNSNNDGKVTTKNGVTTVNCSNTSTNVPPVSWAVGSSLNPINSATAPNGDVGGGIFQGDATRVVYYHTGRTGRGDGDRCKWSILFNIRCK